MQNNTKTIPKESKVKHLFECFKKWWSLFVTLVVMQIKEKLDFGYKKDSKKRLFKIIWLAVEIIVITVICYLVFYFVKLLGVFSLVNDIPDSVISIVFTFMMGLSTIFTLFGLVKSLYFSRDNMVLLTLPVTASTVFLSKLAVYYVYEFRKNFMFLIPLFTAYGIIKNYPLYYYPWLLFMFLFVSAIPVMVAALISIPGMYFYQWIRKFKVIQYALYIILASLSVGIALFLIRLIPANIDLASSWGTTFWKIQDFLISYTKMFKVMYAWTRLIVGRSTILSVHVFTSHTFVDFLILLGVTIALLFAAIYSAKPLFYKMASKPFEYTKKENPKKQKNKKKREFMSSFIKELKVGFRSNYLITTIVILVIVLPICIELLNALYSAMNTRFLGMQMTISFNVLIMLLILLTTNIDLASVYSRDGAASYLNKVQPAPYSKLLVAKLVPNLIIGFVGTFISVGAYSRYMPEGFDSKNLTFMCLTVFFVYVAHLFWSAEMDIMNPQYEQYSTFNNQGNNPNENKSAILAFIMAFVIFGLSLLLSLEDYNQVWIKLMIGTAFIAGAKIFTFYTKVIAFYREN